ncbi:hypothetical protein HK100_003119 [Physocladia obscura]|uniref:BHLH domain-containing protein n=1 Tax=Physocladia obscura TaxID=109957 RepID=A0AAD5XH19_9FUNG|nr:hypothetical protein HK100_003119 [Physocladia obscura]
MEGTQDGAPLPDIRVFNKSENDKISNVNSDKSGLLPSTIPGESSIGVFGMGEFPVGESGINEFWSFEALISQKPPNQTTMERNTRTIPRNLSIPISPIIRSSAQPQSPLYPHHSHLYSHIPVPGLPRQITTLKSTQNPNVTCAPNQNPNPHPNTNQHSKRMPPTPKALGRLTVASKQFSPRGPQAQSQTQSQSQFQSQSQSFHSPFGAASELLTTPFQTHLFSPIPFPLLDNPIDLMSSFSPILPPTLGLSSGLTNSTHIASPSQLTFSPQHIFEAEIMQMSPQVFGLSQHQQQPTAARAFLSSFNPITGSIPPFDAGLSNTELLCSPIPFQFLYPSPLPQWAQQSSLPSPGGIGSNNILPSSSQSAAPPPARMTPLQIMNAAMAAKANSKKRSASTQSGLSDDISNSVISTIPIKQKPRTKIKTRLSFETAHANNLNDEGSEGSGTAVSSPTVSVAITRGGGSSSSTPKFVNAIDSPQLLPQLHTDGDMSTGAASLTTRNEVSVKIKHSVVTSVPVLTKAKRIFIQPSNRKEYRKDAEKHRRELLKSAFDGLNELIPSKKHKNRIPQEQLLANAMDYIAELQKEGEMMSDTISHLEIEIESHKKK